MSQHLHKHNSKGTGLAKAFPVIMFMSQLPGGSEDQNRNNKNVGSSADLRGGKNGNKMWEKDLAEGIKVERHNRHHVVAATAAAPCASINPGLIVVLSVGWRGGNGRGQGVWSGERWWWGGERGGQILQGKQRGESPPFTHGSTLARFPGSVDLGAVYAGDFFSWRLLWTVAWIQLLFRWKEHRRDVDAATGPQCLYIYI